MTILNTLKLLERHWRMGLTQRTFPPGSIKCLHGLNRHLPLIYWPLTRKVPPRFQFLSVESWAQRGLGCMFSMGRETYAETGRTCKLRKASHGTISLWQWIEYITSFHFIYLNSISPIMCVAPFWVISHWNNVQCNPSDCTVIGPNGLH